MNKDLSWVWVALVLCAPAVRAEDWKALRVWTDRDGRELVGRLRKADATAVTVGVEKGTDFSIPKARLSRADRIFAYRYQSQELKITPVPYVEVSELNDSDRDLLPSLNQGEFGKVSGDCGPNAFANFLFWWDDLGVAPLRALGGGRVAMADRAHRQLASLCKTTASGTTLENLALGAVKFVETEFAGRFKLQTEVRRDIQTLADLAAWARGDAAVILAVEIRKGQSIDRSGGHFISLISLDPVSGVIRFNTWGERFTGLLTKVIVQSERAQVPFYYQILVPNDPSGRYTRWMNEDKGFLIPGKDIGAMVARLQPAVK